MEENAALQTEINDLKEHIQQTKNKLQNMSKDNPDLQIKHDVALDEIKNLNQELVSRINAIKAHQQ